MTDVIITFVHKCKEFNDGCGYELKHYSEGWAIIEDMGDIDIEVLGNLIYCPYCGKKLELPKGLGGITK